MRAYFFGNMYLRSIQQGIQAAHATADMFVKYAYDSSDKSLSLHDWAANHKTMILLDGGYLETIQELIEFFEDRRNPYPYTSFNEGQDALGGIVTTVGIILPEKIYVTAKIARTRSMAFKTKYPEWYTITPMERIKETGELLVPGEFTLAGRCGGNVAPVLWNYSLWEFELINRLNEFSLAR